MRATNPHFLLFSSADLSCGHASRWQFVLKSLDGRSRFAAGDEEPGAPCERAELLAVVRGLEALDQPSRVTLVTKSRYVARGIIRCLDDWRAAEWRWERFGRLEPIRDHDLWQRVDRALAYHEVHCHTWPAAEFSADFAADPDGEEAADPLTEVIRTPDNQPAVMIVRNRSPRKRKEFLPVRLLSACDSLAARCGEHLSGCLRWLLPVARST